MIKFFLTISLVFFLIFIFAYPSFAANFIIYSLTSNHDGTATIITGDGGTHSGNVISWCRISDNFCNPMDLPILSESGDGDYTFSNVDLGSFSEGYIGFNVVVDGSNNYVSGDISNTMILDGSAEYNPGTPRPTPTPTTAASSSSNASSSDSSGSNNTSCTAPVINTTPIIIKAKRIDFDSIFISWGPYENIDTFNIRYGLEDGNWQYNINVTGFSTTINDLPANQSIWLQVAAKNNCSIGNYGKSKIVKGSASSKIRPTVAPTGSIEKTLFVAGIMVFTVIGGALLFFL